MGKGIKIFILIAVIAAGGILIFLKEVNRNPEIKEAANPAQDTEKISSTSIPRLIDLGADKCIPCKMMAPILEELRMEYNGIFEVVFIDVWQNPAAGKKFGIRLIPTQIFIDASGKELFRHQGFISKEDILSRWEKLGVKFNNNKTK